MSAISGIVKELIVLSIVGMIYLVAFAPILTEAVTNYTGGGTIGASLGTVVGLLPVAVIAILFVGIALKAFGGKN
jgi:hypothetical protein